jgi:ligand-binding SRPBCC domain-containing protein
MLKFSLQTTINATIDEVWKQFDKELLEKLSPPCPLIRISTFDGCEVNDKVVIDMNFLITKTSWSSLIIENQNSETEKYFIDQGIKMPFGLTHWKHKHGLKKSDDCTTIIIDTIEFNTNYLILDYILFPLFYGMILYRKPLYKKLLSTKS